MVGEARAVRGTHDPDHEDPARVHERWQLRAGRPRPRRSPDPVPSRCLSLIGLGTGRRIGAALVTIAAAVAWGMAAPIPAAGQSDCAAESEPNDTPEAAQQTSGPLCLTGTLPSDDQDIVLWELSAADAMSPWTFEVAGIPGTRTGLKVVPITSEPGVEP